MSLDLRNKSLKSEGMKQCDLRFFFSFLSFIKDSILHVVSWTIDINYFIRVLSDIENQL